MRTAYILIPLLVGIVAIVALVIGSIDLAFTQKTCPACPALPPDPVVDPACEDGNVCTQNLYTARTDHCTNPPRPATTPCNTSCHVPTATSGRCRVRDASCQLGDYTECRAYCPLTPSVPPDTIFWANASCAALFPRNLFFFNGTDDLSRSLAGSGCLANQCVRYMIAPTMVISLDMMLMSFSFGGGFADCLELINPALANVECISATSYSFTSQQYNQWLNNEFLGNATLPVDWVARVCAFRYTCGRWNQTMLNDPSFTSTSVASTSTSAPSMGVSSVSFEAAASAVPGDAGAHFDPSLPPQLSAAFLSGMLAQLSESFVQSQGDAVRAVLASYNITA